MQVHDYFRTGSDTNTTLRDNREAYQRLRLIPRVMVNVGNIDLTYELLGICSPRIACTSSKLTTCWDQTLAPSSLYTKSLLFRSEAIYASVDSANVCYAHGPQAGGACNCQGCSQCTNLHGEQMPRPSHHACLRLTAALMHEASEVAQCV